MDAKISNHISLKEATRSNTAQRLGIDNFPNSYTISKIKFLNLLENMLNVLFIFQVFIEVLNLIQL